MSDGTTMIQPMVWVAWMMRFGDPTYTGYAVDVWKDGPHNARKSAEGEANYRGGKYTGTVACLQVLDAPKAPFSTENSMFQGESIWLTWVELPWGSDEMGDRTILVAASMTPEAGQEEAQRLFPGEIWEVSTEKFDVYPGKAQD